jgi:hypothetical protein
LKRAWIIAVAGLMVSFIATSSPAQDWPRVPMPSEVRAFDIAQSITLNAMPMRLQGFVSSMPADKLVELFRQGMGSPLVESRLGAQRILGRMQGEFYVSVQIEPAGHGSRGTTAVTHLKAALDGREAALREREELTSRLLPGSRVLSETNSRDGAKLSRHLVFVNDYGESSNREQLKKLLQQDGLALQWEGRPGDALFFKSGAMQGAEPKEAIATIHQGDDGRTTVVLNVVTQLKAPQ